jgi:hypothetical protein
MSAVDDLGYGDGRTPLAVAISVGIPLLLINTALTALIIKERQHILYKVRGVPRELTFIWTIQIIEAGILIPGAMNSRCDIVVGIIYFGATWAVLMMFESSVWMYIAFCISSESQGFFNAHYKAEQSTRKSSISLGSKRVGSQAEVENPKPNTLTRMASGLDQQEKKFRVWLFQNRHYFAQTSTNFWKVLLYLTISIAFGIAELHLAQTIFPPVDGKTYSEIYSWTKACNISGIRGFGFTIAMLIPATLVFVYFSKILWSERNALYHKETVTSATTCMSVLGLYLVIQIINVEYLFSIPGYLYIFYMGIAIPCMQCAFTIPNCLLLYKIRKERKQIKSFQWKSTLDLNLTLPNREVRLESKALPNDGAFKLPDVLHDMTIVALLNNKLLRRAFQGFLCQEFSSENIFLWRALQNWFNAFSEVNKLFAEPIEPEQLQNRQKAVKTATKIFEQFIPASAPLMVNISSKTSSSLLSFFEDSIGECVESRETFEELIAEFRDLEAEAVKTMNDSFYRFLITAECKAAFAAAKEQQP